MPFNISHKSPGAYASVTLWLSEHGTAAAQAASLLAGASAGTAVLSLSEDLRETGRIERRHHLRLVSLLKVLMLDTAATQEGHMAYLPIHPDDPRADQICRLADSLSDLLAGIANQPKAA